MICAEIILSAPSKTKKTTPYAFSPRNYTLNYTIPGNSTKLT